MLRNPQRSDNSTLGETSMSYYNIADTLLVEVEGEGSRSVDQIHQMYENYRTTDPTARPHIWCGLHDEIPHPPEVLGYPRDHFGRDGEWFVVRKRSNFLRVDRDWQRFQMNPTPGWDPYRTMYLIEFELRRQLLAEQLALVHASAVHFEGQTILFPSWRCAGKTNTLLSLLFAGGDYLADDRIWVGETGEARGFPCAVNVGDAQLNSFSEIDAGEKELKEKVSGFIDEQVDPSRSIVDKGVSSLNKNLLGEKRLFRSLEEMVPDSAYIDRENVDAVVLLRAAPEQDDVTIEKVPGDHLVASLRAIHHHEWNALIEEYVTAFDSLFPGENRTATFDHLRAEEERILSSLVGSVPTYLARVPRTMDWEGAGIRTQVVQEFGDLAHTIEHSPVS